MNQLRYLEETIFFFLLFFLFLATLVSWTQFFNPLSYPLTVVHTEHQKTEVY